MNQQTAIIKEQFKKSDGVINYRSYKKLQLLGKGGFADCYQVQRIDDKKKYAMKIVPKKLLQKIQSRQKMLGQINLHRIAKHKNIVQLEKVFEDETNVYMLLQLCPNNSLFYLLGARKKLTVPQTQYYLYQLISALCYLHTHNIIHRDVKLGNLLLDAKLNLKLGDFGLATKVLFPGDRKHSICGTPNYIAPEVISSGLNVPKSHSGHSYEVDVWSVGVIMYILLIGEPPFQTHNRLATYKKVINADFSFPKTFQVQSAKDLIRNVLVIDPFKRYTFEQILDHPFMNPVNGIPKSIPLSSLKTAPKFKQYEKYEDQQQIKQSAKAVSITTIRPNPFMSNGQDQLAQDTPTNHLVSRSKEKNMKGLMRSVYSATSLPKSLEKLNRIQKCLSTKNLMEQKSGQYQQTKGQSPRHKGSTIMKNSMQISTEIKKDLEIIYLLHLQKDIIWSYLLSNGFIGTYQAASNNYKLLFNKTQNIYYEIIDGKCSKPIINKTFSINQNISNRSKFISLLVTKSDIKCISLKSSSDAVFVTKAYQIKSENMTLLRLSNGIIQLYNNQNKTSLIMTKNELLLVEIQNNKQVSRFTQNIRNCIHSTNKLLRSMYIKTKKILEKINSMEKNEMKQKK